MKLKTHRASAKRVKVTGTGKMRFQKSAKKHLLINKSKRQKSAFPSGKPLTNRATRNFKRLMPYA